MKKLLMNLTLDFYGSLVSGKRPCLIVIHGGSWNRGNSKQLPELNSYLVQAGYHCAAINYRLAPRWKCPAPIEDTGAALTYLRQHADELNIDKDNFVLLGRSAGGQIALLAAYTLKQSCIKGVIDFYGPADMIWGYMTPTNPLVMNSRDVLSKYVGGDYPQIPEKYLASSPIEFVNQQSVPTLIFHGLTDPLVFDEHSRRLASKLSQHDVPHYYLELPWATHGFDYNLNGPGGQLSTYAIHYFLNVVTS
jgi:acetyl esterase/lipase